MMTDCYQHYMYRFSLSILFAALAFSVQAREPVLEDLVITNAGEETLTYHVEVARTPAQKQRGLMFRDEMPADQGMLFIYQPERPASMWMKNTILSLDMLFIDSSGTIINIAEDTVPFSLDTIRSGAPVRGVLELNAGEVRKNNIQVGDRVSHAAFDNE